MIERTDYAEIARQMYNYLLGCPPLTQTSVSEIGRTVLKLPFRETDWWAVMDALEKVVKEDGKYRMDYSRHRGLTEGLPYNLDFVFVRKGQSIHRKETLAAKAFATANDIYGVRFFAFYCGWCVFETVSPPGVLVDPAWPPVYIIVDDRLEVRWSTEDESKDIWEQEQLFGKS